MRLGYYLGDDSTTATTDTTAAPSGSSPLITLAADLVDAIHPYKQGVPVNLAISADTQSFLLTGGVLLAGVIILAMMRK